MKKIIDISAVAGSKLIRQAVLVLIMVIAARMLGKELVGIWALIYLVIQFGVMLADSGISVFVIREKELSERIYSTAFTLCVGLAIAIGMLTGLLAFPLATLLGYQAYWLEFGVSAAAIVPLTLIGFLQAKLRRERRFGSIFLIDTFGSLVQLGATVFMLYQGFELWAFIGPTFGAALLICIGSFFATGIPPILFDRGNAKTIWHYSRGLLGFSTINFWARNADTMLVGRFLGAAPLGIYSVAYRIMMLPIAQINAIAHTVALPYLSPLQDNPKQLKAGISKVFIGIGMITTVPMLVIWLRRYSFIDLILGEDWRRVGDLMFVLIPVGLLQSLVNPVGLCYQISGRTGLFFKIGVFQTAVTLVSFAIGIAFGTIDAVVVCYAVANLLLLPLSVGAAMRTIECSLLDWFRFCGGFLLCIPVCWFADSQISVPSDPVYALLKTIVLVVLVCTATITVTLFPILRSWLIRSPIARAKTETLANGDR